MKTALNISLVCNLALLGAVVIIWMDGRKPVTVTMSASRPPVAAVVTPLAQDRPREEPTAFHWSQLDSPDYHIYVKNLRTSGCPEPTVRAIVTADADAVYRRFRLNLEQKLAEFTASSWSNQLAAAGSQPALRAELQRLPAEEEWLIAELLGLPAPANQTTVAAADPVVHHPRPASAGQPVALPLVLENFDPAALNLSAEQMQMIAGVRQNFMEQIGGPNQDPNDPAYLARWQQAQPAADNMLQGMLGSDVFIKFQMLQMIGQNQDAAATPPN